MENDLTAIVNNVNDAELISGSEDLSGTQQFVITLVKCGVTVFGFSVIAYIVSKGASITATQDKSGKVSLNVTSANQQQVKQTS